MRVKRLNRTPCTQSLLYCPFPSDQEPGPALVLSMEEMLLTCCSSVSFVSRGKFKNFCLWLAEKFDTEATHWKPDWTVPPMNTCTSHLHSS